jgi:hypothetical protein
MKTCNKCGAEKSLDEFHLVRKGEEGRRPECKQCASERMAAYHAANLAIHKATATSYRIANRKTLRENAKAAYLANREAILAERLAWRIANKDKIKAQGKIYRAKPESKHKKRDRAIAARATPEGRAKEKSQYAARYLANKEKINARCAAWMKANKEKYRVYRSGYYEANKVDLSKKGKAYRKSHPEIRSRGHARRRAILAGANMGDQNLIDKWERTWRRSKAVSCYYCERIFPGRKCHADHFIPLAKGGSHDVANLVVACKSCNLRKNDRMPAVFMAIIQRDLATQGPGFEVTTSSEASALR